MTHTKILVVDDNEDIRDLMTTVLESEGYEVLAAADGVEALQILKEDRPRLMLLDMAMPRLDGRGVLQRLREQPPGDEDVDVLVVTAALPRGCAGWPVCGYLLKPFDLSHLLDTVECLLAEGEPHPPSLMEGPHYSPAS